MFRNCSHKIIIDTLRNTFTHYYNNTIQSINIHFNCLIELNLTSRTIISFNTYDNKYDSNTYNNTYGNNTIYDSITSIISISYDRGLF